jgi:transcriptional regulator with XRE-family HTH domain
VAIKKQRHAEAVKFGERVRELRLKRGMTQAQLAETADMTAIYVSYLEHGHNVPSLTIIIRLANALGMKASDLLRGF